MADQPQEAHVSDATVFSPRREAVAVAAMRRRNAELVTTLARLVEALVGNASLSRSEAADAARAKLLRWCRDDLLAHAGVEHTTICRLVDALAEASDAVRAVAAASALQVLVQSHLAKEDSQLCPLLARSPYVSLADLVAELEELVGDAGGELSLA